LKRLPPKYHPNIVCLHPCSWTVDEKLLIHEYVSKGSLETALHAW
jgi:hypothetical protein